MSRSRRNTSRKHKPARQEILQVRVVTPRTVWYGFVRCAGGLIKVAALAVLLGGIGWAVWRGVQHAFYKNPDFRLAVIDLNQNHVIDELEVACLADIDLTKSPSLFDIDVDQTTKKLRSLPALTAAKVERHLPDTLVVRVIPRSPCVWISQADGLPEPFTEGGILVDTQDVAYPSPANQVEQAARLPVIELGTDPEHPLKLGQVVTHPAYRHCLALLDTAKQAEPRAIGWIKSIRQDNPWSLVLTTSSGTEATFSLGDHLRQMEQLRAALDHASNKGMAIATINLIPKYNVPVTLRSDAVPPRAVPVEEPRATPESQQSGAPDATLNRP